MDEGYKIGAGITGLIVFTVAWIYCIATYGFLLGVGLGWLPAIITAYVAAIIWPIIAFGLMLAFVFLLLVMWPR